MRLPHRGFFHPGGVTERIGSQETPKDHSMRQMIAAYAGGMTAFLAIDAIWLSIMGPRFYKPMLGDLVLERFSVPPAIAFYLIFGVGLTAFAIMPALSAGKPATAALMGALFGLVAYATYDLTNQATLRNWPLALTLVDMTWGAVLSGLAAYVGYQVASRF